MIVRGNVVAADDIIAVTVGTTMSYTDVQNRGRLGVRRTDWRRIADIAAIPTLSAEQEVGFYAGEWRVSRAHMHIAKPTMNGLQIVLMAVGLASAADAQTRRLRPDTILVSDRYITDTTVTGAVITAKFRTADSRAALFRLDGVVDTVRGRSWVLSDILVTLDLVGNGSVARWKVAGPRAVVEAHLKRIREMNQGRRLIYDLEIRGAVVRCACD